MSRFFISLLLLVSVAFAQDASQSAEPPLPASVPANARMYQVLMLGNKAGQMAVWDDAASGAGSASSARKRHVFFQFNDRGRGPKTDSTYEVREDGTLSAVTIAGNDYMKSVVDEKMFVGTFVALGGGTDKAKSQRGTAVWKSASESGRGDATGAFYSSLNGPPEENAMMIRAALKNGGALKLLPAGEVHVAKVTAVKAGDMNANLYAITGLDFTPSFLWLDDQQELFATGGAWFMCIRKGYDAHAKTLVDKQTEVEQTRLRQIAHDAVKAPPGDLVFTHVGVFNPKSGTVLADQTVTIRGNKIVGVGAPLADKTLVAATVIDGKGKTLIPGLWDMHVHIGSVDSLLHVANGVTSVRDLANDNDELKALKARVDRGENIGPRIIAAGFIDGPGPYQGPTKVLADTPEKAREFVDMYASWGYPQIKIYSSLKPELVPVIIDEAHKKGMRVSGHIPAGMTAAECVKLGQDEIQHMNMVFLSLMPEVKETRTPARFIEPGKRAGSIDLESAPVKELIALFKEKHTVIDPTLAIWEATYLDRPGQVPVGFAAVLDRFPATIQRGFKTGGQALPVTAETDPVYRKSYANFEKMLKKLYDAGVTIVAGTDNLAGYSLHRELEIYQKAGIPAGEVLRIATLGAATVMKKQNELGTIEPGKLADVVLLDGDPTQDISNVRKINTVIKDGKIYDTKAMLEFLGVRPN